MHLFQMKSISQRLVIIFLYTSLMTLGAHMMTYINIHQALNKLDYVYASNTRLTELSECLNATQNSMYTYLNLKSSNALEDYYREVQNLQDKIYSLESYFNDQKTLVMENHVEEMIKAYLEKADDTVQAKRGRNIKKYNERFKEASQLKDYIETYIESLNNNQFKSNTEKYMVLRKSLNQIELINTIGLIVMIGFNAMVLFVIARQVTKPLKRLADSANKIAEGHFDVELSSEISEDEVGVLSRAFNKMVISIKEYIEKLRRSMEIESEMKENELKMENYLKDAKLKYLEAQISPHFLFNTLNAGVQLAMMEDAMQTSLFIENMAAFFRYSMVKEDHDTTLEEELGLVDHYVYILDVRFCREVQYEKKIDSSYLNVKVPRMILQPIVENAFQYGVRDLDYQGIIILRVYEKEERVYIEVQDNGKGITKERIDEVMSGKVEVHPRSHHSNGIGIGNVISRLRLFYGIEDVIQIESKGENQGTTVRLTLPITR